MNHRRIVEAIRVTALVSVAVVTGCTQPRIARPANLAPLADEILITNRSRASGSLANETFGMGPYQLTRVHRGSTSTKSSGWSIGGIGSTESKSEGFYDFDITTPVGTYKGVCGARTSDKATNVGSLVVGGSGARLLDCNCSGGGPGTATVFVELAPQLRGAVMNRGGSAAPLEALMTSETGAGGGYMGLPLGYEAGGTTPLGAVEVTHPGRVWINRTLTSGDQSDLACLFAGLLLYKPPSDT